MHPLPEDEIYAHLRHLQPWCRSTQAIVKETPRLPHHPSREYQYCDMDPCILIQTRGDSSVRLSADYLANRHDNVTYTEIILREGMGLFVPFVWWYSIRPSPTNRSNHTTTEEDAEAEDTVDAPESVLHKLGWCSMFSIWIWFFQVIFRARWHQSKYLH